MKVGWNSVRIAIPAFLLPYIFVMSPELLMIGDTLIIIRSIFTGILGGIILAIVSIGYLIRPVPLIQRLILLFAAISLVYGGLFTDILGLVAFLGIFILQKKENKNFQT